MSTNAPDELMTPQEHEFMSLTAKLWDCFVGICGPCHKGSPGESDKREAADHINALQNMILAQAAARAYPTRYRPINGSIRMDVQAYENSLGFSEALNKGIEESQ